MILLTCDLADFPAAEASIERTGPRDPSTHVCDLADIPAADVSIERTDPTGQDLHVCDLTVIPVADLSIERIGPMKILLTCQLLMSALNTLATLNMLTVFVTWLTSQ